MSIALIVTAGFGNGTLAGEIAKVVTRGYLAGEAIDLERPSGGFFDFPDTPPRRKKRKKEKKIEAVIERIAKKVTYQPDIDKELALRLALVDEKIRYNKLYLELLVREVQKRKKRRKKIMLLLTGDG